MKHPNTHNKHKRERQEEALHRREANVKAYEKPYLGAIDHSRLERAKRDVEILRKKLNLSAVER